MGSVKVILHCKGHCIETAAKKEFESLMAQYFDATGNTEMIEMQIALLSDFLKTANFPKLRSSDPRLSGEIESTVVLERHGDKDYILQFC